MPNFLDDSNPRSSNRGGAVRRQRRADPILCEYIYPDELDEDGDEVACGNRAVNHTDPPRCVDHGGVHAEGSRKRTEAGYMRVNPRMKELIENPELLSKLSDEELVRGQLRSADGKFHGKGTEMVPRNMHAKMMTELFKRANDEMKMSLVESVRVMKQIAEDVECAPKDRMRAAEWIVERVLGKTPETLNVHTDKPWQQMMVNITNGNPANYEQFVKEEAREGDDRF